MLSAGRLFLSRLRPAVSATSRNFSSHKKKKESADPAFVEDPPNRLVKTDDSEKQKQKEDEDEKRRKFYEDEEHRKQTQHNVIVRGDFERVAIKNRETFLQMLEMFKNRDVHRRNHCEFIYAALKHMRDFNVHNDLSVYKELIAVMPQGKFVVTNMFQDMFMHYPKQQQCIIYLLDEMALHGWSK